MKIHSHKGVYGAESQDRTGDPTIFSRVLYQLSYLGKQPLFYSTRIRLSRKPGFEKLRHLMVLLVFAPCTTCNPPIPPRFQGSLQLKQQ